MQADVDRVLISEEKIHARVRELAAAITRDHTTPNMPGDAEVVIVPILTGAMIFCGDLIRDIPIPMRIGLIAVSSYPGTATTSQGVNVKDYEGLAASLGDLTGRHVVVVDDILDSGHTLATVVPLIRQRGAASVKTCVLLRKDRQSAHDFVADYIGFEIPDEFVVGYGLDFDDYYRNLPDIVTLKREVFAHLTK